MEPQGYKMMSKWSLRDAKITSPGTPKSMFLELKRGEEEGEKEEEEEEKEEEEDEEQEEEKENKEKEEDEEGEDTAARWRRTAP